MKITFFPFLTFLCLSTNAQTNFTITNIPFRYSPNTNKPKVTWYNPGAPTHHTTHIQFGLRTNTLQSPVSCLTNQSYLYLYNSTLVLRVPDKEWSILTNNYREFLVTNGTVVIYSPAVTKTNSDGSTVKY